MTILKKLKNSPQHINPSSCCIYASSGTPVRSENAEKFFLVQNDIGKALRTTGEAEHQAIESIRQRLDAPSHPSSTIPLPPSEYGTLLTQTHVNGLRTTAEIALESMADALRPFTSCQKSSHLQIFFLAKLLTLAQALRLPPNQIHHTLIEAFTTLLGSRPRLLPTERLGCRIHAGDVPKHSTVLGRTMMKNRISKVHPSALRLPPPLSEPIATRMVTFIQEELGPDHPLPVVFRSPTSLFNRYCTLPEALCGTSVPRLQLSASCFQILGHETGCVFLDASTAYDPMPYDYTWSIKTIQTLKRQWKKSEALTPAMGRAVDKA
ncbi:MAG: hypothetical protein IPK92_15890 [Nitrospira sp.]|nr:hypothetical protein [Nitrospira sp.]